jgi:hypothetical protein
VPRWTRAAHDEAIRHESSNRHAVRDAMMKGIMLVIGFLEPPDIMLI